MKRIEEVIRESIPTLVVFQHAGKHDAVEVKYLVQELLKEYGDKARIERVDCSYNGDYKVRYKLEEYPTWILFKQGEELMRESGNKTLGDLSDMLKRAIG